MPGKDPLSQLGDLEALQANADKIIEIVTGISTAIKEIPGVSLKYKESGGGAELKKNTEDLVKANNELTQAQKMLNAEQEKAKTLEGDMALRIAQHREANKALSKELQEEARATLGLNDAYKKLTLQYQEAARAAKNLAATPGTDPKELQAANAKANSLAIQLKAIDAAVGQHQRNVGDYIGAISILDKSLGDIKNRMDQLNGTEAENGAEMRRLQKEYALLTSLSNQQARGFTSLTMEIRAGEKALQTMRAAGMEGSEAFEAMQTRVAQARREFNEFSKSQQMLESAAPKLAALTTIAKGLGGAYAIAAGGAALLADGDEKVEKELNKLVAIMTVLQGLNEVHELLEKKGAIATIASTTAQGIKNFVLTGSVRTLAAKNAAETANTVATEANTVATEANIVAQEGDQAAMEATAVATAEASAGMVAFRVALMATGIGTILILISASAAAMGIFRQEAEKAAKTLLEVEEMVDNLNESLMRNISLSNEVDSDTKKGLESTLSLAEKAKENYYQLWEIRRRIAENDRDQADTALKQATGQTDSENAWRRMNDTIEEQRGKLAGSNAVLEVLQNHYIDGAAKMSDAEKKHASEAIDNQKKLVDIAQARLDKSIKLLDDYNKADEDMEALEVERKLFAQEEQTEYTKAQATARAQAIIDKNALILSNDRSTEQQRLAAQSASFVAQLQIIEANKKAQLDDPSVTPVKRAQIELEAGAAVRKARLDNLEKLRKIMEDYQKREDAAEYQIMKDGIESQSKISETQMADIKLTLNQRIAAYDQYEARQRQLINADADYQRQKAGLTSDELFAIEVQRQQKLTDLYTEGQAKQSEIILSALDFQSKKLNDQADINGLKEQVAAYEQLVAQFKAGKISADDFGKAKQKLEGEASTKALNMQLVTLQYIEGEYKKYGEDTTAIDKQIYQIRKQLADNEANDAKLKSDEKKKRIKQDLDYAKQASDTIAAFIDGQYEREINAIQKKIDANDRAKEKEVSNIETSSLSEQQKAAAQIELNAKVNAQNEALQRQQRNIKIKEAEFDKQKGILDVVINTAKAVTDVLPNVPLSIIMAGIGAAQIATILARPVPKFAGGTKSSPEGWAWTDELGPELYKTKSGQQFIGSSDGPTLRYLEAGTEITPHGQYGQPETELITYDQLKQYQHYYVNQPAAEVQNNRLERKIDRLTEVIEHGNRETVSAIRRNKPIPSPRKPEPSPEFWAHIYNSCR